MKLAEVLQDNPPPYDTIVFDCDSTLATIEGVEELAGERQPEIKRLTDAAMDGGQPLEEVFGLRLDKIQPSASDLDGLGGRYVANLLPNVAEVFALLRALGKRVCIVSGGLRPAVLELGRRLGIGDEDVFAVDIAFHPDGRYDSYDRASPLARSGGKPEVLRGLLAEGAGAVCLVGDGVTDLEAAADCARFVAFGGVERREPVFAAARVGCSIPDFAALVPLLLSEEEMARALRTPDHLSLMERAQALYRRSTEDAMLWIPGPTQVRPEVLSELARPAIGHRTQACRDLIARCDPGLRMAFGLKEDSTAEVAVHSSSGTGLMEASLLGAGPRVLSVVNGAFSKRFLQIARSLGKDATELTVEWGRAVSPEELERVLRDEGPFDAVTLVSNETSTGVRTQLPVIAEVLARFPDTHLLVDMVSYLAGAPADFDQNGIDFAFASVQKALALPPGISVMCASARYLERAAGIEHRGFYLDPITIVEGHKARKTPATPATPLYYALARQLEDISAGVTLPSGYKPCVGEEAWRARFEKHARMQQLAHAWARRHDLELFPALHDASPTVSCIQAGRVDVAAFCAGLKQRGFEISNGYGDLKGRTFRIGHMGDHDEEGLRALLEAADQVLAEMGAA